MDNLCKLGFIGAELLLKDIAAEKKGERRHNPVQPEWFIGCRP